MTFTTLFPSCARPNHGIFVENRLRHLIATGKVASRVVAPVPFVPPGLAGFGEWSAYAGTSKVEVRDELQIAHPRYPVIPKVGMSLAPALMFAGAVRALASARRERDFDLIDAHYFYPDGVAAILLGRLFRKPVVITARGTDVNLIPQFRLPRAMILAAARRASGIVAVSQALKDAIVALGLPQEAVTVLRNGVDLDTFHPGGRDAARSRLGLAGPTLVSVGHLIERKGHANAIGALPRLKDYVLLIVGDGPQRGELEMLARNLGVEDRVRFLRALPHRDLQQIYVAADALVLASSREGWPNVLLEAMACGTPAIATAAWGNPEVVASGDAGLLMNVRSADGVADAVERLFKNLPDRNATRAYAERFSWDATSQGQIALFEKILAAKAPAS